MTTIDKKVEPSERPLVTIVMPHWNTLPYITDAVESIARQTFRSNGGNLEVKIIDDGSSEHEFLILKGMLESVKHYDWGKTLIRSLYKFSHRGKNRVLEAVKPYIDVNKSKYTIVADSDDIFGPHFVQILFNCIEKARASNPNVVMAYGDSILINERGYCVGTATAPDFDRDLYFGTDGKGGSNFIPGNAIVLTERFLAGRPHDLDTANRDKLFRHMAELGDNGAAVHVADRIYFYRQRDGQMSGHGQQLEDVEFFARLPEDVPKLHWREWVNLPRTEQLQLLTRMPNADTSAWNHYLIQPCQAQ